MPTDDPQRLSEVMKGFSRVCSCHKHWSLASAYERTLGLYFVATQTDNYINLRLKFCATIFLFIMRMTQFTVNFTSLK
ncbi:MAG: hypothetical protein ACJAY1_001698 [Glaciecola sp.]|jgi:hypothetical protein